MEAGRLFEKTRSWSKLLFFIPFTIALFVFAVFFSPFLTKNYVEGDGIVTNVEKRTEYDADNTAHTVYDTTFTYTIEGKDYDQTFSLNEQKAVGDKITFYYDPQDPQKTSNSMNNAWLWLVFLGLGTVSAFFTVYTAVKDRKRQKQTDALRAQKAEVETLRWGLDKLNATPPSQGVAFTFTRRNFGRILPAASENGLTKAV